MHELVHALALFDTEQAVDRHLHALEEQFRRVLPVQAHLFEHATHAITREVLGLHHQNGQALAAIVRIGAHHQHEQAGEPAIGDESLAAVDHVVVALLHGARADAP